MNIVAMYKLCFIEQLKFPQALALNGEIYSRQTKLEDFDYGVNIKATINKTDSSQVRLLLTAVSLCE